MPAKNLGDKEAEFVHEFSEGVKEITGSDIEDLRAAIAEAAYYRAEKRGFEPGYEVSDWVEAEQEIQSKRTSGSGGLPPQQ